MRSGASRRNRAAIGVGLLAFLILAGYGVARPAIESLFLAAHGSEQLPWVWLANVHWYQSFTTLSTMVKKLGPEVNLGNIEISMLVYAQMIRNGAGTKLEKDRQV